MCRSIKRLYNVAPAASHEEVRAAARQFVRKISGMHEPSQVNRQAFEGAIEEVAATSEMLLASLTTTAAAVDREVLAVRARERWQRRGLSTGQGGSTLRER